MTMEAIKCIVIDDEPLARKGLKEYISEIDFLKWEGEFDSALKASKIINEGKVQLIFLDIQMPRISGIDFLRTIGNSIPVIFTTAFPQYALDGFDLNALDYVVKPISFERFLKAALKANEYYEVRCKNVEKTGETKQEFFFIKADNKLVRIFYDEILYVEALQNYVAICTRTKKYITYLTIKSIEEYLSPDEFIRTHKSYIVSASKIDNIDGNDIRIGDYHIPISRNNKEDVMERLLKGRFLKR
jgi:DNA-binding LytR/AlgR family response regulator